MTSVSAEVKRTISVGNSYNISGSYGYAGIDNGQVKVLAVGHVEDLYANTQLNPGTASAIESHTEVEIDSYSSEDEPEAIQRKDELENGIWVVYIYKVVAAVEEEYVLPLDTFLEHTSML